MDLAESINKIIKKAGRDIANIKYIHTKTYVNISFYDLSYIRVKLGPKAKYISVPKHFDYLLLLCNITATESGGWNRIDLDHADDIFKLSRLILEIFDYCRAKTIGETFGCCSKYVECSDAKSCTYENEIWSKGCIYRINLIKGKIFYGRNAMS